MPEEENLEENVQKIKLTAVEKLQKLALNGYLSMIALVDINRDFQCMQDKGYKGDNCEECPNYESYCKERKLPYLLGKFR